MWSALGRLVGVKATPTDVEPPPPPAASEGRTGFPNPEARTVVLVPVATTPAAHGGKRPAQQTGTSLAAATTPHYASAAAEREAKRLRPGPFQLVEPGFVSGGNPGGAQGWRAVSSGTVATTLVLKGGGRDAKSCATQPSKPALASPFALVPTAFSALLAVAHDEFPAATVTGDRWAWWVPPGVTHEELLRCYTWELAQAFKHTLVQRFSYQYSADLPQYIFSRNYADVLTSEQLVDAARHFRPPVQQRLGLYTDLFGELLQEVSAIVMRQAGLVLADNVGLSELTELLSELCLRPPTVGSDGKLRILLPRDGEFKPKNAQVLETVNRWGLGTASRAWWVDELVAPNAPLPPMGTRLLYAVMLAEAHMTQGEAERILGHVTVDRTQPHTLELMIRMKPKLRTGSALCRTRNLGILTLPSDFLVSEFVDALADPDVADILRPKEDPRRSKSSPGSARTPFAASPARTGRAKATSSDPSGAGSGSEPEVEWLTLVLYNKSIEAQAQGLVYPQPDLGLARDTNFMAGEGWSAHGRTLDEIRVDLSAIKSAGRSRLKAQAHGGLTELIQARVAAINERETQPARNLVNQPILVNQPKCDELFFQDMTFGGAAPDLDSGVQLQLRTDCALADLLPPPEERVPSIRRFLKDGAHRRYVGLELLSSDCVLDIFVLRRLPAASASASAQKPKLRARAGGAKVKAKAAKYSPMFVFM